MKWIAPLFLNSVLCLGNIQAAELGDNAPDCLLKELNESLPPITLKQFEGQVVYLDFWASWCGPCAKSFPYMNALEKRLKHKGLKIIAVNVDENIKDADDFLSKLPANFTVGIDVEQKCAKDFNVQAMPSTYLIDQDGIVRHIHLGFRSGEVAEMQAKIDALLAKINQ